MKPALFPLCALCGLCGLTLAEAARTSADYSIPAESADAASGSAQSTDYAVKGNAVGEFGAAADAVVASTDYAEKGGFVGQLYEIGALSIMAPPSSNLNETASRQLVAMPLADDATTLGALNPTTVAWSVVTGPIASITIGGLATAGTVYQDAPATVGGSAQTLNGQLNLTILNVNIDDFGAYGNDGIDDSWQVQYFGQPPNPLAGPNADADGTGQTNLFKFVAGLNPLDGSRFTLSVQRVNGQPSQMNLVFQPLVSGRSYDVEFSIGLTTPNWQPLTGTTQSDDGAIRTVTDPSAAAPKYYHVKILKP